MATNPDPDPLKAFAAMIGVVAITMFVIGYILGTAMTQLTGGP